MVKEFEGRHTAFVGKGILRSHTAGRLLPWDLLVKAVHDAPKVIKKSLATDVDCILELDGKFLLLKIPHARHQIWENQTGTDCQLPHLLARQGWVERCLWSSVNALSWVDRCLLMSSQKKSHSKGAWASFALALYRSKVPPEGKGHCSSQLTALALEASSTDSVATDVSLPIQRNLD